jgi:hypothetical protein
MANFTIDNQLSERVLGIDNDLAPFFKSVSCWALLVMWITDMGVAVKVHERWQVAGHLFFFSLLAVVATATLMLVIYYRSRLAHSLAATNPEEQIKKSLRQLSSGMIRLEGVLLLLVLFTLSN